MADATVSVTGTNIAEAVMAAQAARREAVAQQPMATAVEAALTAAQLPRTPQRTRTAPQG